jgi:Tn3 transposase DDE domain
MILTVGCRLPASQHQIVDCETSIRAAILPPLKPALVLPRASKRLTMGSAEEEIKHACRLVSCEAKNVQAKAVFFNRLGEMRDRSFENQRYRASCLKEHGLSSEENLLQHLSPLGWEHINLSGDYVWRPNKRVRVSTIIRTKTYAKPVFEWN